MIENVSADFREPLRFDTNYFLSDRSFSCLSISIHLLSIVKETLFIRVHSCNGDLVVGSFEDYPRNDAAPVRENVESRKKKYHTALKRVSI